MNSLAKFCTRMVSRWLPDPLVIAIALTGLALALAILVAGVAPLDAVDYWGTGFWDLLSFTMQMTVILLAGYMLAKAPPVDRSLDWLVSRVSKPKTAIVMITLVGGIGSWLNWGFGLVAGSVVAKKAAMRIEKLHYPLAIAAGFSGFSVYGIGLSGSVPLLLATPEHFLEGETGLIPISETIFNPFVLGMSAVAIFGLPVFNALMHPAKDAEIHSYSPPAAESVDGPECEGTSVKSAETFGEKMNDSPVWGISIGTLGIVSSMVYFARGGTLNLDAVNFIFIMLGLLLFARPKRYLKALNEAVGSVAGIIVQYPFYAGIMAILVGSGLIVTFSNLFVSVSTAETLPLWSFISGGLTNILVPSGGGQFVVQGPVMIAAAQELGADFAATAVAVQIGDQWTNMIQPFWIIPALAISGLKLRDVMGYMVLIAAFLGLVFGAGVLAWGIAAA